MYKDIWTPKQGNRLDFLMEPDNRLDSFAVCVKTNEKIVGHLKKCTKTILSCLQRQSFTFFNLGDGEGMQVPCKLSLSGQRKFVSLLRKELIKMKDI